MPFSTKSYLAGVGTVIAALTVGFSSGFFLAPSTEHVEQNRLQRITSSAPIANPTPQAAVTPVRSIELVAAAAPAPSTQRPARTEAIPVMARAVEPAPAQLEATATTPEVSTEKTRAEAKAERKRAREQRRAERRKQREIALATVAAKRMLRDRDPQQVADRTESSKFGFFGED